MVSEQGRAAGGLDLISEYKVDLPSRQIVTENKPTSPRKRRYDKFLLGPIPLGWLTSAAKCSGKAFHVGVVLWYLAGLTKSFTIKLSRSTLNLFSISRWAANRNLRLLELAGLVTVDSHKGRAHIVTIIDTKKTGDGQK